MNPMQLIQMLKSGQDPSQYLVKALQQSGQDNPMNQNLISMIQNHDAAGIESLVRNLAQSQGKDYDKEFASFKKMLGL